MNGLFVDTLTRVLN